VSSSFGRSGVVIVAMVALAQCLPLWGSHWFDSHEHSAYVLRVVEFESALRQGDLYPRWASDFYGGYGSPFFVFYAPLVFAGGAAGSALLGSAVLGLKLWISLASIAAGVGVYVAVQTETRRADAALLAALAYLASSYRLADLYVRGDLAEYTALAILPWAIWGYRRIGRALPAEDGVVAALLAASAHAGVLFSHAIMGLWGTLLIGGVCLATTLELVRRRTFRHIGLLWAAFGLALALSSVYTGPALLQKRYVHIAIASARYYDPANQLLPFRRLLDKGQFGLLPLVGGAFALSLVAVGLRSRRNAAAAWSLAALSCVLLSLRYAEAFWLLRLPLTGFIQFPWRLHGLAVLSASFALGIAWSAVFLKGSWREPLAMVLGAAGLLLTAPLCTVSSPLARNSFPDTTSEIRDGMHSTTEDEYLPLWVAASPKTPASSLLSKTRHVELVGSFSRGTDHDLEVNARGAVDAELRLHMFPGWRVETLEGPARASLFTSRAGLVGLKLPGPGHYRLRLTFGTSPARAAFAGVSLLAALAAWPLLRLLARRRTALAITRSALSNPPGSIAA
jgi:hypothetical protein